MAFQKGKMFSTFLSSNESGTPHEKKINFDIQEENIPDTAKLSNQKSQKKMADLQKVNQTTQMSKDTIQMFVKEEEKQDTEN